MKITRQEIAEIRLIAQYSDDPREYHREMARASRLEALLEDTAPTTRPSCEPVPRRSSGRLVASSVAGAIAVMEAHLAR